MSVFPRKAPLLLGSAAASTDRGTLTVAWVGKGPLAKYGRSSKRV